MTSDNVKARTVRVSMISSRGVGFTECLIATTLFTFTCLGLLTLYQQQISVSVSLATWRVAAVAADEKVTDILITEANGQGTLITADAGGTAPAGALNHVPVAQLSGLTRRWHTNPLAGVSARDARVVVVVMSWQSQNQTGTLMRHRVINSRPLIKLPRPAQFNPALP
ncbi:hypothetical protein OCL06_14135 [Alteromonas sp. ASW11-19]|uniref:Pilus assembly protein n=1 Tax=Alteromonas salexigens TaxID=2982530 RepID=A0ABT2VQY1_9ALTE|nr:hypothetical protein [Alteromonas salexigens]MCU7555727.1 hypothetical protein [Alteromonas salexigens]